MLSICLRFGLFSRLCNLIISPRAMYLSCSASSGAPQPRPPVVSCVCVCVCLVLPRKPRTQLNHCSALGWLSLAGRTFQYSCPDTSHLGDMNCLQLCAMCLLPSTSPHHCNALPLHHHHHHFIFIFQILLRPLLHHQGKTVSHLG